MKSLQLLLAALLVAGLPSAAVAAPTEVPAPSDPYVHTQTGTKFPAAVGDFVRHKVTRYSDDGSDVGTGYQLIRDGRKLVYVSVFVYPGPSPTGSDTAACDGEFEAVKTSITGREPTARLIREDVVPAPDRVYTRTGRRAIYEDGVAAFDGKPDQRMHEEARLYCYAGGRWLVSYRMSWPQGSDFDADVAALLTALPWTPKLARP